MSLGRCPWRLGLVSLLWLGMAIHLQLRNADGALCAMRLEDGVTQKRALKQSRQAGQAQAQGCASSNLNFGDMEGCVSEFDAATLARSPGAMGRELCTGLAPYAGFNFVPAAGGPTDWVARRVPVSPGARGTVGCGGAVVVGDTCTALTTTYEGPARNPGAANVQKIELAAAPQGTFTLRGLSAIVYSMQGVRLTGNKADGGTVSLVLEPNALLDKTFPASQWSNLVGLEFRPDITGNSWQRADELATMKIFWFNTTLC